MSQYTIVYRKGGKICEFGGNNNPLRSPDGQRVTYNVDINAGPNVDLVADFNKPLPLPSEEFDGVYSSYAIEHISFHNVEQFIKEIYRILKPSGKAIIITANLLKQAEKIVEQGVNKGTVELIFGSQEFPDHGGVHKTGFSPEYAKELFEKVGFKVKTYSHPVSNTDLIIEAYKIDEVFERQYFEDGTIGYMDYRDFATHYATASIIMAGEPTSVIDVGCGRGYIVRILENKGIKAVGIDISKHCWHSRATDSFILWDATKIPWEMPSEMKEISEIRMGEAKIPDKKFDLCFSCNFLEHIPEDKLNGIIREMVRVSNRGLHGIHMTDSPYEELDEDIDITHHTIHERQWWVDKFKTIAPDYQVIIEHPRTLEYQRPTQQPPTTIMPASPDTLLKLNIGSYLDMFYYWVNIDILDLSEWSKGQAYEFLQHDITKGVPFKDETVDLAFSSHLIEHLDRTQGEFLLKECYRVLKPGGILRVSTPDTQLITKKYLDGTIWDYKYINVGVEQAHDGAEAYYNLLLAGHKTIYDENSLTKLLEKAGFKEIKRCSPFESRSEVIKKQTITLHPSLSVVLEAVR